MNPTLVEELRAGAVRVVLRDPPSLGSSTLAVARDNAGRRSAAIDRSECVAEVYRPASSDEWEEQFGPTLDEVLALRRAGAEWQCHWAHDRYRLARRTREPLHEER